jgi:citrate synthase
MSDVVRLELEGKSNDFPTVIGTEGEKAINISELRRKTGYITLDAGYPNTGSCLSAITFIDGETGILRYRGIPIEELAEKSTFVETAYLLIYGRLPTGVELTEFRTLLTQNQNLHEDMRHHFEGFPSTAHPMAMLSAMINASSCFYPGLMGPANRERFDVHAARLLAQVRTIAAFSSPTANPAVFLLFIQSGITSTRPTCFTCSSRRPTKRTRSNRRSSGRST